jgi:hypothetical protein
MMISYIHQRFSCASCVELVVFEQMLKPYAMIECKRVGIEEGTTKGPQTIEKAKQGAYVAGTAFSSYAEQSL